MKWPRPLVRSLSVFLKRPPSVRSAIRVIVTATVVTTFLGAVLVWLADRDDFATFADALWWSLQTVTTVGYGDVTPKNPLGRVVGAAVLLYAVAFLALLTAAITTSFIERARSERLEASDLRSVLARLDDIAARLDRLERRSGESEDNPRRG